jgi:cytochrome c oxidase cbb3-type subunit 3
MTSYASLPREERQQLASYILSMQGTNPEGPKKPEGNKWVDGAKTDEVAPE